MLSKGGGPRGPGQLRRWHRQLFEKNTQRLLQGAGDHRSWAQASALSLPRFSQSEERRPVRPRAGEKLDWIEADAYEEVRLANQFLLN
jgi:hypothetical protein